MAAASGFTFGASSGLFGSSATTTPAFGAATTTSQQQTAGFSFGAAKSATTSSAGLSFGASSTGLGLSAFGGKPAATVGAFTTSKAATQASQTTGFNLFSTTTTSSTTSLGLGTSLFGAAKTTAVTATPFQLASSTTTAATATGLSLFGTASLNAQKATNSVAATSSGQKPPENPKDAQVAAPLMEIYKEVSKHIKEQRARKDEIARYSAKLIHKATEEIVTLKQQLSEVSNGMQRDAVGVENLKGEVSQELNFADIARRLHEVPTSLQHDYTAPFEYFCMLVMSFETRIKAYRQELDELELYLSTSTPLHDFSPQDLFNVLRQLNDTFLALAAQLHAIHEAIQSLKSKYLQYRRIVLNDTTDVFGHRSRITSKEGTSRGSGPSPFAGLAGPSAVAMAAALNRSTTGTQISSTSDKLALGGLGLSSLSKSGIGSSSSGMSRSLSFSGLSSRGAGTSLSLGSSLTPSLFGKSLSTTEKTPQFQLQNPPGTKRGKKD